MIIWWWAARMYVYNDPAVAATKSPDADGPSDVLSILSRILDNTGQRHTRGCMLVSNESSHQEHSTAQRSPLAFGFIRRHAFGPASALARALQRAVNNRSDANKVLLRIKNTGIENARTGTLTVTANENLSFLMVLMVSCQLMLIPHQKRSIFFKTRRVDSNATGSKSGLKVGHKT